jgi:formate dehydrogenase subunit gamma
MAESWAAAPDASAQESDLGEVLRFERSERHLHWAIAIPFMVCYVTAAILVVVYNPNPALPLRALFSWIHRLSGACLVTLPPLAVAWHWRDFRVHLRNLRWGWKWTLDDVKWLVLMGPATFNPRIPLPRQGKFNAGEKINFIAVMCTYPVYVVTGLMIWLSGVPFLSWIVHVCIAAFVATPLMLGHIFMALVNPDTRVGLSGMLTGFVDRRWARHHYRHWYDQTFEIRPAVEGTEAETGVPVLSPVELADDPSEAPVAATPELLPPAAWQPLPGQVLAIEYESNRSGGQTSRQEHRSAACPPDRGLRLDLPRIGDSEAGAS